MRSAVGGLRDDAGTLHAPVGDAARIVSLVPSITELLCELGLAGQLVGRTGFCVHPREVVRAVPKVGGTKDPDLEAIRAIAPTHVVLNVDENRRDTAEALASFVPHLVVTHPMAPGDNLRLYTLLGGIFGRTEQAAGMASAYTQASQRLSNCALGWPRERVLYLIWRNPWMTVSRDTYLSRTLALAGWDTVPVEADVRYPEITLEDALAAGVDRVLLSSEPYRFRERHVAEMGELLGRLRTPPPVTLIDGEMTSWYGSRAIRGLDYLRELRAGLRT
jgi:ABC-type Fe3+-hydroxamate transport system substrate-binding protein